jgi:hypothetical protein
MQAASLMLPGILSWRRRRLHVIGITRFSLANEKLLTAFTKTSEKTYADAVRYNFDPRRLARRLALFRTFPVPSMRAQQQIEGVRLTYLVLVSTELPQEWKDAVRASVAGLQDARVFEIGGQENFYRVVRQAVVDIAAEERVFTFRLDDDDALSANYLRTVIKLARGASDTVICMDRGIWIERLGDRIVAIEGAKPFNAQGIGYLTRRAGKLQTIFNLGDHRYLGRKNRCRHETRSVSWIRGVHADNDSPVTIPEDGAVAPDWLRFFPHIDPVAAFAALSEPAR